MADKYEYDIFLNSSVKKVYLSPQISLTTYPRDPNGNVQTIERPMRILNKVAYCEENHEFIRDGKEISLRITGGQRYKITAKFYEDTRGIFTLQFQKFTIKSGLPNEVHFTFRGSEILALFNFLKNVAIIPIVGIAKAQLTDEYVKDFVLSREQLLDLFDRQPELRDELLKSNITAQDIALLGKRREQLKKFRRLLDDTDYFTSKVVANRKECVWQQFFEENTWIFGYGLSYVFNAPLDDKRLEQSIKGHDITGDGKRVDALLKTQGLVSAFAFGEIKTHTAKLLKQVASAYRGESWQVSDALTGGIAQVHRSVQVSLKSINSKHEVTTASGAPTGETIYTYRPRAFLVIGSLSEFEEERGINEQKYSSFELFRRNMASPEIITFDELYERAKYIVEASAKALPAS